MLETDNDIIDEYIKKYKGQVKEIVETKGTNSDDLYDKYGIHIPVIFEYKDGKDFFDDSKIYLFDSEPYKTNNWNHGYAYYMEKNEKLKKLLLVTEVW